MIRLLLIFTVIPLLELYSLIKLSNYLGTVFVISLVAVTGILGATFTKKQGTNTINKIKNLLEQGLMPADSLIDGFLILIGGIMLITPGLLTDLGGFSCIIPFTRSKIKILVKDRFNKLITTGTFQFSTSESKETRQVNVVKEDEKEHTN